MLRFRRVLPLWVAVAWLVGCGPQPTPEVVVPQGFEPTQVTPDASDVTFKMAISGRPRTLDPGLATDNQSAQIVRNTFEGLMSFDREAGPIRYGVAHNYTLSEDGRVYTFELRDTTWSDGTPLTAQDFVYAWKRVLYPSTASEYAWLLTDIARIKGADELNTGRDNGEPLGVVALDDRTLQVTLDEPVAFFLDLVAFPTFAPIPSRADQDGVAWNDAGTWISNGPFVLDLGSSPNRFVLSRNDQYWDLENVGLAHVEISVFEDDDTRIAAFDAGDLDWTGPQPLPMLELQSLAARREFRQDATLAVEYLVFNTAFGPLSDQRVREAIDLAIDRNAIVTGTLGGEGQPAYGFVPPIPGYPASAEHGHGNPEYGSTDADKARGPLREAGFPNGAGFPTLHYLYPSSNSNAKRVGELIKKQLAETLSIELSLDGKPLIEVLDTMQKHDFELARAAWVADFVDPISFLGVWASNSQQNDAGWKNSEYDALLLKASKVQDRGARYELYKNAESILDQDVPVSPLYFKSQTYLLGSDVEGFAPHKLDVHLLKYVKKRHE